MEKPQVRICYFSPRHSALMWGEYAYYSSPLSFVGQGWGRLPLSFPGNTPSPSCHSMATGQTASDRIVCLHRRGNKDQGESELGQRDLPPCTPRPYHQGEDRPYTGASGLGFPSRDTLSLFYWLPPPTNRQSSV